MVVPLNTAENLAVEELANKYYKTCKADENSGKTIWLGVEAELNSEEWKVTNMMGIEITKMIYRLLMEG